MQNSGVFKDLKKSVGSEDLDWKRKTIQVSLDFEVDPQVTFRDDITRRVEPTRIRFHRGGILVPMAAVLRLTRAATELQSSRLKNRFSEL